MTYIVQYRVPEATLQTSIDEVMGVLGVDCLEARPLPDDADTDPGADTSTWFNGETSNV